MSFASDASAPTIAIIGGGFSGTLVAVHLLRTATAPIQIKLIERRSLIGQGVAYSTPFDCHLLNVPASKMSAFADQPNHFLEWAQQKGKLLDQNSESPTPSLLQRVNCSDGNRSNLLLAEPPHLIASEPEQPKADAIHAQTFASRRLYGEYLYSVLANAVANASVGIQWEAIIDEAISIQPNDPQVNKSQVAITLSSGRMIQANQVVLALGNFPPKDPPLADQTFYRSRRYIRSVWSTSLSYLNDLTEAVFSSHDTVLVLGSGLTAIDQVLALHRQQHRGKIWLVSRRGLLPQVHQFASDAPLPYSADWLTSLNQPTLRALLQRVRQEIKQSMVQGYDWRVVIDSLRAVTPSLWQALSLADQQRFLRHVRPYWDIHRHRLAPEVAQVVSQLQQSGQLQVCAGRIQSYTEDAQGVDVMICRRNQASTTLRANWVLNCTGSEDNYNRLQHPLVQQLLAAGLICPDSLNLGLVTQPNGKLVQADGTLSPWLYTLGSPCKGQRWETTAVPELRVQAKQLAEQILCTPVNTESTVTSS